MNRLDYGIWLISLALLVGSAAADADSAPGGASEPADAARAPSAGQGQASEGPYVLNEVVVTATRRSERLKDVPISITTFSQEQLTQMGIVGVEGIARETPGVVFDDRSDNNFSVTTRGISTNGYQAGLQSTTTVYLDDVPLTTIGNSVTLDPSLFDVERVEFLRGPQGTLFGSGSLSGALRILTHSPDLGEYDASALVDVGLTPDGSGIRQRYNGMLNIPLIGDKLALRVVGFNRHEEGYVDNVGTGVKNSNTLKDSGGRVSLLWAPTDRLKITLKGIYEDSHPEDASLTTPSLGDLKRYTTIPDLYTSVSEFLNATIDYQFNGAHLTSSSSYGHQNGLFDVDLGGTFALTVPFYLFDHGLWKTFVEETRLVSDPGGAFDWVVGVYYLHRNLELDGREASSPAYLAGHGITGLPADATFYQFNNDAREYELAGFADLTYHVTQKLSVTGGLRDGRYGTTVDNGVGFNSRYFIYALYGLSGPLAKTPTPASTLHYPSAGKTSWRASITYEPSHDLTLYTTVSTGYRTPVYNARAGSVSTVNPQDVVIPAGATSDNLTNYEIGTKGSWLNGKVTANLAAYYIDWRNLQIQANRLSDSVQFATNVGRAKSQGLEAEVSFRPLPGFDFGLSGSWNDAKVTELSAQEAEISGAVAGTRLASPHVQGALFGTYSYDMGQNVKGATSLQIEHVGSFPDGFPNTPGTPDKPNPLFGSTDPYTIVNLQTGIIFGKWSATLYGENLGNKRAVTYIHPEAFTYSRDLVLRPLTVGMRFGYNL